MLKTTSLYSFTFTEAFLKVGSSPMYTAEPPILYPEACPAEDPPRSTPNLTNQTVCTRRYGAVRSLLRWLFLHRRLRSRQRGPSIRRPLSGVAPGELIISRGRCPFLSGQLANLTADLSKPFGFGSERTRQRLSAPSALERCVTASVPPLGAGQNARKQSRL